MAEYYTPTKPVENEVALVELSTPVKVMFKWSDKIVKDIDEEGNILEYESGWIMHVLSTQVVYKNENKATLFHAVENE